MKTIHIALIAAFTVAAIYAAIGRPYAEQQLRPLLAVAEGGN